MLIHIITIMKTKRVILGIDPGLADTGYGVVINSGSDFICLDYGVIKTKAFDKDSLRLKILYNDLLSIIDKYQPDLVAVEQLFFNTNAKTAILVGQARGVVLLAIEEKKIPMVQLTPPQVKLAVTAYGQAPKKQVQLMVQKILNLAKLPCPDDAADALAVAIGAASLPYVK
jgi:crossover junction endodeoxyribonuclease RuvC